MNSSSIIVLVVVVAFAALAVWRNLKKGAPCECSGSTCHCKKSNSGHCDCCE